ncbi:phosphoribosylanthranilate isomerase [Parapedobacter sp. SGR-10]|uniref:phosphoribosylanthranilate isomerase n=1 Tax=Parapedobacter sp. SGR-10 TaxID=2710879 RepID=UPI0013D44596|nr:phosphoribosylanthranilate isomerase [Parapedobacter sp. SGR-10]NGF55070.1 phosphoribosylanthranilate isomerase [Parapedobacter sp. SGR-10]
MKYPENIEAVAALPVDYMGFIFYPKSSRYVEQPVPLSPSVQNVGVFVNEQTETILQKVKEFGFDTVQLHGNEPANTCQYLRDSGLYVFKAFGIDDEFDWTTLEEYLDRTDVLLFDTKSPQHGGTGQAFNWEKLKEYPYDKSYFLSGGLSLENIGQASRFEDERMIGLDLNSKFEIEPGLKDINLLTQALKIIKNEQISGK